MSGSMDAYVRGKLIGKGSFGDVFIVTRRKDLKTFVMKKMGIRGISEAELEAMKTEVKVLTELEHPCITQHVESFVGPNQDNLCIVMGYCEGGDLTTFLKHKRGHRLSERQILYNFVQLATSLEYMHSLHVLHRDLKTQNIFIKEGLMKLGDFGISKIMDGTVAMAHTVIGTPYYMSPELFKNQPYNFQSDVWALGCVLYEMTTLKHAFDAQSINGLAGKIIRGYYPPISSAYSKGLRNLVKKMLSTTPSKRPPISEILALPFLKKYVKKLVNDVLSNPGRYEGRDMPNFEEQIRRLGHGELLDSFTGPNNGNNGGNNGNIEVPLTARRSAQQQKFAMLEQEEKKRRRLEQALKSLEEQNNKQKSRIRVQKQNRAQKKARRANSNGNGGNVREREEAKRALAKKREKEQLVRDEHQKKMEQAAARRRKIAKRGAVSRQRKADERAARIQRIKIRREKLDAIEKNDRERKKQLRADAEKRVAELELWEQEKRKQQKKQQQARESKEAQRQQEEKEHIRQEQSDLDRIRKKREWLEQQVNALSNEVTEERKRHDGYASNNSSNSGNSSNKAAKVKLAKNARKLPSAFGETLKAYSKPHSASNGPPADRSVTPTPAVPVMSRQMSAKERVLARKQARKEEEEAKRRAQLLAARKDYHAEKQQASLQKNNMYRGSHEQAAHQASSSPQPQQQQYQHQQEYYDSGNEEYDPTESTTSTSDEEEDEEDEEDIVLDEAEVLENEKEMRFLRTQLNEHTQYIKNLRNSIQIGQQVADVDHDPELDALHEEAEEEDEGYMSPPPAASGPIDPDPLMSSMTNPHLMQSLSSSLQSILSPMEDPSNDNVVYQSLSRPLPTFSNDRPTASSTTTTTTPTVSVTSQKQIESEMAVTINPNSSKMFTMSPYERLKLLTTDCVKQLGKKVFMQAYTYLRKVQEDPGFSRESDDRKVQADLTVILGKDRIHLWKMLDQIIFIEANC